MSECEGSKAKQQTKKLKQNDRMNDMEVERKNQKTVEIQWEKKIRPNERKLCIGKKKNKTNGNKLLWIYCV